MTRSLGSAIVPGKHVVSVCVLASDFEAAVGHPAPSS